MISPSAAVPISVVPQDSAKPAVDPGGDEDGISFSDVLSALNPLQYLPVVGTIYRAVTGDRISEPLRVMGSIVASGLMGGPLGLAVSAGSALVQHLAGIDLDHVAHDVLAAVGILDDEAPPGPVAPAAVQTAISAYGQTLYTYGPGAGHA
jgi:hypothetical protein